MANDEGPMGTSAPSNGNGSRVKSGIKAFGQRMSQEGQDMIRASQEASQRAITQRSEDTGLEGRQVAQPSSYHRGGKVRKGGVARVRKGEVVLTKGRAKKLRKKLRGKNGRM